MKAEEKAIILGVGKYQCPNCNRMFQKNPIRNPKLKNYECPKCLTVLEIGNGSRKTIQI